MHSANQLVERLVAFVERRVGRQFLVFLAAEATADFLPYQSRQHERGERTADHQEHKHFVPAVLARNPTHKVALHSCSNRSTPINDSCDGRHKTVVSPAEKKQQIDTIV